MRVQLFSLQPWHPNDLHNPLNSELCLKLRAYLSKDSALFVKPIAAVESDEELTVVAIGSSGIGTSNHTSMIEPQGFANPIHPTRTQRLRCLSLINHLPVEQKHDIPLKSTPKFLRS
jgi:hypothetical protein